LLGTGELSWYVMWWVGKNLGEIEIFSQVWGKAINALFSSIKRKRLSCINLADTGENILRLE